MAEPLDFELEIGPATAAGYPVTARLKGAGEASGLMHWSVTGRQLDAQLAAIQDSVLASTVIVRRLATLDEQPVREFGQRLFEAAIRDEVRVLYGAAYQRSRQQNRLLRLVLRIRPPELGRLPWEYMFDERDDSYLGLRMPLVRYPQVFEPQRSLKVSPPLNVLAMVARPADQAALDVRHERQRLEAALHDLEAAGEVKLAWVHGQSWRDLRAALDSGPWHVFHFIGHGAFDGEKGEGVLALAGDEGGTFPLGASALSMVLSEIFSLRLVVLNACDTGRSSSLDSFSSVAGALVRRGIPAVLAMQFEITDRAAIEFTRTFYDELARRRSVDACAMRARQAIYIAQTNSLEWGTPVLYLRSSDGQIFDFSEADPARGEVHPQRDITAQEPPSLSPERYAEGLAAFHSERWEEAVGIFRQLLAEQPNHPDASLKLQQALKQVGLAAGYMEAIKASREARWTDAVKGFEAVLAADPGYRDAQQHLEKARIQRSIADLQDEARNLYDTHNWEAVVRIGERLRAINAQSADPDGIVSQAQRSLKAAHRAEQQTDHHLQLFARLVGALVGTASGLLLLAPLTVSTRNDFNPYAVALLACGAIVLSGSVLMIGGHRAGRIIVLGGLATVLISTLGVMTYRPSLTLAVARDFAGAARLTAAVGSLTLILLVAFTRLPDVSQRAAGGPKARKQSVGLALALAVIAPIPSAYGYVVHSASSGGAAVRPGVWSRASDMTNARFFHTATLLGDGTVLVVGGKTLRNEGRALSSAELYDPASNQWRVTPPMSVGHQAHAATPLPDGNVLIAGGFDGNGQLTNAADIYDVNRGTWSATTPMLGPPTEHLAVPLSRGRVLFVSTSNGPDQIYDSNTGSWTLAAPRPQPRDKSAIVKLTDGRVMVIGGSVAGSSSPSTEVQIYDPMRDNWQLVAGLPTPRAFVQFAHTITLNDGRVLLFGGYTGKPGSFAGVPAEVDVYSPIKNTWSIVAPAPGPILTAYFSPILKGAAVLVSRPSDRALTDTYSPRSAKSYVYDVSTDRWTVEAPMSTSVTSGGSATVLSDGRVLVAGGALDVHTASPVAELYSPG